MQNNNFINTITNKYLLLHIFGFLVQNYKLNIIQFIMKYCIISKKFRDIFKEINFKIYPLEAYFNIRFNDNKDINQLTTIMENYPLIRYYFKFSYNYNITDLNLCKNLYHLELCGSKHVTDVSMLGNVHTLNLSHCHRITDVSKLGNVNELII